MRNFGMFLMFALLIGTTGCKKEDAGCGEGIWPDGYSCHELKADDEEIYCKAPVIRYWAGTGVGNDPKNEFRITPEQGVADIYIRDFDGTIAAGDVYESNDLSNQNAGSIVEVRMNQATDANGNIVVNQAQSIRFEIESISLSSETLSGKLTYSYLDRRTGGNGTLREFRVELTDNKY